MALLVPLLPVTKPTSIKIDGVDYYPPLIDSAGHLQVDILSTALATGAATSGKQDTMITALQLIDDLRNALNTVATQQLRVDIISLFIPSTIANGRTVVTTAGTRVRLSTLSCKAMVITAQFDNTGKIYLGTSTVSSVNGYILEPGDSISLMIDNRNRFYIDAEYDGDGISSIAIS